MDQDTRQGKEVKQTSTPSCTSLLSLAGTAQYWSHLPSPMKGHHPWLRELQGRELIGKLGSPALALIRCSIGRS